MRLLWIIVFLASSYGCHAQVVGHRGLILMGSTFELTVVSEDSTAAEKNMDIAVAEIKRIEKVISSWDIDSETSKVNRNAGIRPVQVSEELFDLILRAVTISRLTDGAFDISFASMDRIWKFDGSMTEFPSPVEVEKAVGLVGYKNIILDEKLKTVYLQKEGMKIGFGAIGKGYAADKAKELLQSKGVEAGIINASGDMCTWGCQPDGKEWVAAITNPMNKHHIFTILPVSNKSLVTSGDYERYVTFDGVRYAHIIDPRTGYPTRGIISVSVIAESAELADALATSVFVMGSEAGVDRINQLPNVECIIVADDGSVVTSKNIKINEN